MHDKKAMIFRLLCFVLSIASLLLSCLLWYLGLASAVASIACGFLYGKYEKKTDRLVVCGMIISALYILVYILVFVIGAAYFSDLDISPLKTRK